MQALDAKSLVAYNLTLPCVFRPRCVRRLPWLWALTRPRDGWMSACIPSQVRTAGLSTHRASKHHFIDPPIGSPARVIVHPAGPLRVPLPSVIALAPLDVHALPPVQKDERQQLATFPRSQVKVDFAC
jgi:hypothetical protein